jgi:Chaperone of endosialidase
VGIGTSSPNFKLQVAGPIGATGGFSANQTATAGFDYQSATNNSRFFSWGPVGTVGGFTWFQGSGGNSATSTMTLDSSGNLGLGVTPSAWRSGARALQLGQTGYASLNEQANGSTSLNFNCYESAANTWTYYVTGVAPTRYTQQVGVHSWFTAPSGTAGATTSITSGQVYTVTTLGSTTLGQWQAYFSGLSAIPSVGQSITATATGTLAGGATVTQTITFTQAMTLDASGNLVVGNTSANGRIEGVSTSSTYSLVANNSASSADQNFLQFRASSTIIGDINRPNTTNDIEINAGYGALTFGTGTAGTATERARITSLGDLLVGKTALGSSTGFSVDANFGSGGSGVRVVNSVSTSASDGFQMYSTGAGAYRFFVGFAGTVNATSTTIAAISDQRLKENIQDLDVGLDKLMALKPRKFDWKAGKGKDIKGDRGWIAQEFEQVFPDMIDTWKDPAPEGEEPYKSVRADLIPVLVKAIQEQQALITSLTARVTALEGTQP